MAISDEERKRRDAERQREYRKTHKENPELKRARQKRYMEKHKDKYKTLEYKQKQANKAREYRRTHPDNKESHRIRQLRYQIRNSGKIRQQRRYIKKDGKLILLKEAVLKHYGNGILACVKCGYSDIDCLTIDHIHNDAHHRQNNGRVGGTALYRKLRKQNYPQGFQTLCINCNFKKSLENLRHNGNKKLDVILEDLPLFRHGGIFSDKDVPPDVIKDDN